MSGASVARPGGDPQAATARRSAGTLDANDELAVAEARLPPRPVALGDLDDALVRPVVPLVHEVVLRARRAHGREDPELAVFDLDVDVVLHHARQRSHDDE